MVRPDRVELPTFWFVARLGFNVQTELNLAVSNSPADPLVHPSRLTVSAIICLERGAISDKDESVWTCRNFSINSSASRHHQEADGSCPLFGLCAAVFVDFEESDLSDGWEGHQIAFLFARGTKAGAHPAFGWKNGLPTELESSLCRFPSRRF